MDDLVNQTQVQQLTFHAEDWEEFFLFKKYLTITEGIFSSAASTYSRMGWNLYDLCINHGGPNYNQWMIDWLSKA